MTSEWAESSLNALVGLRTASGWGYRVETAPCVEPTGLAALALLATADERWTAFARRSADWLASIQRPNGSLGVSEALNEPGWGTPYGSLAWSALGGYDAPRRRAVDWLLKQAGETFAKETGPNPVLGHDPSIAGWPWVDATHSWVEPTALAVLALRREGRLQHPRVQEGMRMLRDRAVATGGWNAGNKATYGRTLRAQPAPTGIALLALAGDPASRAVAGPAVAYLRDALPGVRAAESLSWGLLGLRAWGQAPPEAEEWLKSSAARVAGRPDAAPRLALLVLATSPRALELFDGKLPEA
jgi:hypothetical protein